MRGKRRKCWSGASSWEREEGLDSRAMSWGDRERWPGRISEPKSSTGAVPAGHDDRFQRTNVPWSRPPTPTSCTSSLRFHQVIILIGDVL